jgi:hypothetical protein
MSGPVRDLENGPGRSRWEAAAGESEGALPPRAKGAAFAPPARQ